MRRFVVPRPALLVFISLGASIAAGVGCAADFGSAPDRPGEIPPLLDSGGLGVINVDSSTPDANPGGRRRVDPRCGTTSDCDPGKIPDDPLACADHTEPPPPPPPRDGGRQDDTFDAGTTPDAGTPADAGVVVAAPEASVAPPSEAGPRSDASIDGGVPPPTTVPENPSGSYGERFACQVGADSNGNATHKCEPSGTGGDGAPCSSTKDCRAGFGCVGEAGAGECRPYCCDMDGDPCGASHDAGTRKIFCGDRLLLEPGREPTLRVPVCIPAEECTLKLKEPYPCTGASCECGRELTCTVVAGTTGCVKPGSGKVGDQCPCAAGYFCSSQNQCMKLCETARDEGWCAPGKCQATAGFPDGYGVCVGLAPTLQ